MSISKRVVSWISTWVSPVTPEFITEIEKSSKAAANALALHDQQAYLLQITSRNVEIVGDRFSFHGILSKLKSLFHGLPQKITLFQPQIWGFIGPFGKLRKRLRVQSDVKENAILFWPCPYGKIDTSHTQYVLKIAVGSGNHARENRMLRMVHERCGLAPAVIANDSNLKWLVLDYMVGNGKQGAAEQSQVYIDHIAMPYFKSWTCKSRDLTYHLSKNKIKPSDFLEHAAKLGFSNGKNLLAGKVTFSITHGGGICEECIQAPNGNAYLLDWEKAAYSPVAEDLIQVFHHEPDKTIKVMTSLQTVASLGALDQLCIALILRHIFNAKKQKPKKHKLKLDFKTAEMLQKYLS